MSRMPTHTRPTTRTPTAEPAGGGEPDLYKSSHLLRLLHLASPALPIGTFHFSQGLEYAVEAGWVHDEESARDWIGGVAQGSLATLDLPVLHRLLEGWRGNDERSVIRWNAFLLAARETAELRAEDRHLGSALLRVLAECQLTTELFDRPAAKFPAGVAHATAFSFACARWGIDARAVIQTYAWAWLENQVLNTVKLVPLGQSAGQRIIHTVVTPLGALCERSGDFKDSDIGISGVAVALASGRHETQYTRLYRS